MKISVIVFLIVGTAIGAYAHTFFVDTWEEDDRKDLEEEVRFNHIALESGMMDVLFEKGHIFFNIYTSYSGTGGMPLVGSALDLAGEEGADYLIELIPDENGATWRLFSTSGAREPCNGYANIESIDEELEAVRRWMALGSSLAEEILAAAS